MPNLTSVTVTSGVPTAGSGTVSTLDNLPTLLPSAAVALGKGADAASMPVALSTESFAALGATNETAPASDTATAGHNGRLQRIAQRLTSLIALVPTALGPAAASASLAVTLPSDASASASITFTPAASSHTAGDCVGAAGNFATLGISGSRIMITSATLYIDNTAALATAWRVHLYNVTPTSAIADDAAWDFADADVAQYLGSFDLPSTATDIGTNQWAQADGINKQVKMSGTGLFAYLQCLSTVTTTATAHLVTINTVQL